MTGETATNSAIQDVTILDTRSGEYGHYQISVSFSCKCDASGWSVRYDIKSDSIAAKLKLSFLIRRADGTLWTQTCSTPDKLFMDILIHEWTHQVNVANELENLLRLTPGPFSTAIECEIWKDITKTSYENWEKNEKKHKNRESPQDGPSARTVLEKSIEWGLCEPPHQVTPITIVS